jgi:SPP1 gp7 family putative phage head morphogenesis protein
MPTVNEEIRDELTRHKIGVIRFGNGVSKRITAILNRAEPELQRKLKARLDRIAGLGYDPGPATTARMIKTALLIKGINDPTFAEINKFVRDELVGLAKGETIFVSNVISQSLPVVYPVVLPSPRQLRGIVFARPIENEVLAQWLKRYQVGDQRRIMDEIRQGLVFSETPTQISRRIFGTRALNGSDGAREITRRGAQTLAQTTASAIQNGVYVELYKENKRIIRKEIYVATLDSRTTPICQSLDGQVFDVGEGWIPPVHFNCRSVRSPIIDGRRLGSRPATTATSRSLSGLRGAQRRTALDKMVGRVPAETTYQKFLTDSPVAFQNEVLGPTRGRLFRKGEFDLDAFVNDKGQSLTLRQLYDTKPGAFQRSGIPAPPVD